MAETSFLPAETPIATHWGTGSLGPETVAPECPDPSAKVSGMKSRTLNRRGSTT